MSTIPAVCPLVVHPPVVHATNDQAVKLQQRRLLLLVIHGDALKEMIGKCADSLFVAHYGLFLDKVFSTKEFTQSTRDYQLIDVCMNFFNRLWNDETREDRDKEIKKFAQKLQEIFLKVVPNASPKAKAEAHCVGAAYSDAAQQADQKHDKSLRNINTQLEHMKILLPDLTFIVAGYATGYLECFDTYAKIERLFFAFETRAEVFLNKMKGDAEHSPNLPIKTSPPLNFQVQIAGHRFCLIRLLAELREQVKANEPVETEADRALQRILP